MVIYHYLSFSALLLLTNEGWTHWFSVQAQGAFPVHFPTGKKLLFWVYPINVKTPQTIGPTLVVFRKSTKYARKTSKNLIYLRTKKTLALQNQQFVAKTITKKVGGEAPNKHSFFFKRKESTKKATWWVYLMTLSIKPSFSEKYWKKCQYWNL